MVLKTKRTMFYITSSRCRRFSRSIIFHSRLRSRLQLARSGHFPYRNYRGERARRSTGDRHRLSNSNRQKNGEKELFGQKLGSRGDPRIYFHHLFG